MARRRRKFGGLNSCWRENVRVTSFLSKKGRGEKVTALRRGKFAGIYSFWRENVRGTSCLSKNGRGKKVIACRRQKFGGLNSCWRENVRATSFLGKKGRNGPPQVKVWWIKYVAAGGKIWGAWHSFLSEKGRREKVKARRRRKFGRLDSCWRKNVRGTSFLRKNGKGNGPPQAKIWWIK